MPLLAVGTLVFPYVGGAPWAYMLIFMTLAASAIHMLPPRQFQVDAGDIFFIGAFLLIAVPFVITGRSGTNDAIYALNFAMFVLFVPLRSFYACHAAPGNALLVARLALAGAVLAAIVALYQVYGLSWSRARGIGSNPLPSSTAALLLGFLSLMGLLQERGNRRYVYLLGPLLGIIVVFLSEARGPLLGAAALTAVSLLTLPRKRVIGVAALALVAVAGTWSLLAFPERFHRIGYIPQIISEVASGEEITDRSGEIRYRILLGSLRAFADSPLVGHGWRAKTSVVDAYLTDKVFGDSPKYHLHSDILNFAVSAGLVGLLGYLMVLLAPAMALRRSSSDSQYSARRFGVTVLTVGYAVCGATNILFGFEFMTTFFVLVAALLVGYCRDSDLHSTQRLADATSAKSRGKVETVDPS